MTPLVLGPPIVVNSKHLGLKPISKPHVTEHMMAPFPQIHTQSKGILLTQIHDFVHYLVIPHSTFPPCDET